MEWRRTEQIVAKAATKVPRSKASARVAALRSMSLNEAEGMMTENTFSADVGKHIGRVNGGVGWAKYFDTYCAKSGVCHTDGMDNTDWVTMWLANSNNSNIEFGDAFYLKLQRMIKPQDTVKASTIPWGKTPLFAKRSDGKKWKSTTAMCTMQCMFVLMQVPINKKVVHANDVSYKCWLHLEFMPSMLEMYEYARTFEGTSREATRAHNGKIISKVKAIWKKLHKDGRARGKSAGILGEDPFDGSGYELVRAKLMHMAKLWTPARAWLYNKNGEEDADPMKLEDFLANHKKQEAKLREIHDAYIQLKAIPS